MVNTLGTHHLHQRKKNSTKQTKRYDAFMSAVGIGVPLITSSQVFKIWCTQNAQGVSIIAWSAYLFNSLAWLVYGCIHKEKPIILTNIVCSVINVLVILGSVLYG